MAATYGSRGISTGITSGGTGSFNIGGEYYFSKYDTGEDDYSFSFGGIRLYEAYKENGIELDDGYHTTTITMHSDGGTILLNDSDLTNHYTSIAPNSLTIRNGSDWVEINSDFVRVKGDNQYSYSSLSSTGLSFYYDGSYRTNISFRTVNTSYVYCDKIVTDYVSTSSINNSGAWSNLVKYVDVSVNSNSFNLPGSNIGQVIFANCVRASGYQYPGLKTPTTSGTYLVFLLCSSDKAYMKDGTYTIPHVDYFGKFTQNQHIFTMNADEKLIYIRI